MKKLKWYFGILLPMLACAFVACGDDDDKDNEPNNPGNSGTTTANVLTIDGEKWSDPKITVFNDHYAGYYYFTYLAIDYTNGARNFDFHADADDFDEVGEDIAEDIEVNDLGDYNEISLIDMDTEYISGKVVVEQSTSNYVQLNFKNYTFYFYPRSKNPSAEYKHTVNGVVKFTRDGE